MAINWYPNQSEAEGCRFGALAMLWPLLQRMQVASIIDRHLPADPQAEFSHGKVLSLLIAARLFSPVALVNVGEWAAESGADILWGMPVQKINDDRLGRSVEAFFDHRHSILASLALAAMALHVSHDFETPIEEIHYDPTHLIFHGAYEASQARAALRTDAGEVRSDGRLAAAHITAGRPMSDAPKDVRLIHAGLCTIVDAWGPPPIFGHTISGNDNGHTAVAEQLALLRKHLRPPELTMISDRGTFSVGHLLRLKDAGYHAIAAAPWDEFRGLFDTQRPGLKWKQATYLSIQQQRRRAASSLPQEHYELAVVRHELTEAGTGRTLPCRVIFVFSTADQKVASKNRDKSVAKLRAGLQQIARSVEDGRRCTDPTSIARRVGKLFGQRQAAAYFRYAMLPLSENDIEQLPSPTRGCRHPDHCFQFTFDQAASERDAAYDGYSAMVATTPWQQSADLVFTKYKQQGYSELANHEFKTPLAVHPVFLKSPRRVEALVFLMMVSLTAYFLLQRMYRKSLPANASPKEHRTTTQTLLRAFSNYVLITHRTRLGREVQPTRLTTRQREILGRLGFDTPAQILFRQLPRAP